MVLPEQAAQVTTVKPSRPARRTRKQHWNWTLCNASNHQQQIVSTDYGPSSTKAKPTSEEHPSARPSIQRPLYLSSETDNSQTGASQMIPLPANHGSYSVDEFQTRQHSPSLRPISRMVTTRLRTSATRAIKDRGVIPSIPRSGSCQLLMKRCRGIPRLMTRIQRATSTQMNQK